MRRSFMPRSILPATWILIATVACSQRDEEAEATNLRAVRDTVLRLEEAMNSAVDSLDCDTGLTALGDREPAFVSGGHVVRTGADLREMCQQMVTGRTGAHFEVDELTANVLTAETAYVVREGNYTIDLHDGSSPSVYMVMTTVWHREDDGWKMVHLHESFVLPNQ